MAIRTLSRKARTRAARALAQQHGHTAAEAAVMVEQVCDYGAASGHFDEVAPFLVAEFREAWRSAARMVQSALDAAQEEMAADIDRYEAGARLGEHPGLAAWEVRMHRFYGEES